MALGYGEELLGRVSGLVAACTRRVSRATRRLLRRHYHRDGGTGGQRRMKHHHQSTPSSSTPTGTVVAAALCARGAAIDKGRASAALSSGAAEALWSRRILMGERCQPLDFDGAIHYDSFGRLLARPPVPRSASFLSCRSSSGSGRSTVADADVSDASYPRRRLADDADGLYSHASRSPSSCMVDGKRTLE